MSRYLRSKNNGSIYEWDARLAPNPVWEEVTEEEAYPERFVTKEIVQEAAKKRLGRPPLSLATEVSE